MANQFDVIILGGGPAGYVAAIRAAQLGMSTAVVERDKLGGVCVNIGCIPTKALLHSAYLANALRSAAEFGIDTGPIKTNYGTAMQRSRKVADQNSRGVEFLMKKNKVTVVKGVGALQPGRKVKVGSDTYEAKRAVLIATGSRVKGLPQAGLEINKTTVISSDEALFLERAPASLAIIGAGAVGMEFADVFAAFGTQVTLIEVLPRLLPLEDAESSDALAKSYKKRKIDVLAGAVLQKATVRGDGVTLEILAGGATRTLDVATVLLAAGRAVNTENIGLKEAGVALTERGFIKVDRDLQTSAPGIYAVGDVAGPPMLAHKGFREGTHAVEHVAGLKPPAIKYDNVPSVTYCHPEVASIGLTEEQCKERTLEYQIGRFPFSASGRARGTGETEGFVKIIRGKKYSEILGAHIVGSHASELIHELTVARENEYTVEEVELAIHAHPTLSEAIGQAALDSLGRVVEPLSEIEKDRLAIGLGALACGVGLGGGIIAVALTAVRISQRVGFTRYGEALADSSLDLVMGLGAGMAIAAGFGWRRSRALDNDWQRGVIAILSVVGALIMAFLAVPFWHFFHFIGLTVWTLANVALGVAGSAWAVKGSKVGAPTEGG